MSIKDIAFVRDIFWGHCWHLFLPTDTAGKYARIDLVVPAYNPSGYPGYVCIGAISFGYIRPGKVIRSSDTARGATETGTWGTSSAYEWYFRSTYNDDDYVEIEIDPQYDRVQAVFYNLSANGGTAKFEINDGGTLSQAGLDVTSYNTGGDGNGVKTVVIDTGGHLAGRKLRITRTGGSVGALRLIGVQCFDTDGYGDPDTVDSGDGLFQGHDHILLHDKSHYPQTYIDCKYLSYIASALEYALYWSEAGGVKKWTGGSAHFNSSDYPYTYASGTYSDGPNMFVDGAAVDDLYHGNHSRGEVISAKQVTLRSKGQPGGGWSTGAPDITWEYDLSRSGIAWRINIDFNAASEVDTVYCPMLPAPIADAYDLVRTLPDKSWHTPGELNEKGIQKVDLLWNAAGIMATSTSMGPVEKVFCSESSSLQKLYFALDRISLTGGSTPGPGDSWNLGGRLCLANYNNAVLEQTDIDNIVAAVFARTGITAGGTYTYEDFCRHIGAYLLGTWRDKSGTAGAIQEILDWEDDQTVIMEYLKNRHSPYKQIT